jgi:16S rRNA (cytosine967-C5)-methyltransferase
MAIDSKAVASRAKALPQHVEHLSVVIAELMRFAHPADMVVSRYFRSQPRLGNRDRALIAEASLLLFGVKLRFLSLQKVGPGL